MLRFGLISTPVRLANEPVKVSTVTPSALNEASLKPVTTTQKACDQTPPFLLMTSWTSSLPNVSLLAQNPVIASGNGLSVTGPGMAAVPEAGYDVPDEVEECGERVAVVASQLRVGARERGGAGGDDLGLRELQLGVQVEQERERAPEADRVAVAVDAPAAREGLVDPVRPRGVG